MPRYCLAIEFNGSGFCGWQSQAEERELSSGLPSIQAVVLKALGTITRQPIKKLVGCGRTDSGVHAEIYYAHFDIENEIQEPQRLRLGLDAVLPASIGVLDLRKTAPSFHALEDIVLKTYEYRLLLRRGKQTDFSPSRWWIPCDAEPHPNVFCMEKFRECLNLFSGRHDFLSFAASGYTAKTSVRTIESVHIEQENLGKHPVQGLEIRVSFRGNGFLRHQVRNMMGTAVRAAQGKIPVSLVSQLLAQPSSPETRPQGVHCAPAYGLRLKEVSYK